MSRRRPRPHALALAAIAALGPARPAWAQTHALGTRGERRLRGGDGGRDVRRRRRRGRGLAEGAPPAMTNWALTALEPSSSDAEESAFEWMIPPPPPPPSFDTAVAIEPFTADLLAPNFPYQLRYRTERELSGAVSLHVASYLRSALDPPPLKLSVDCKRKAPSGVQRLECAGAAVFGDVPRAAAARDRAGRGTSPADVNAAVHQAFVGEARVQFLEVMYPDYEMAHEKREWDVERGRRRKKTSNNKRKKSRKEKKRKKQKPKKKRNKKQQKKPQQKKLEQKKPKSVSDDLNVFGYVSGQPYKSSRSQKDSSGSRSRQQLKPRRSQQTEKSRSQKNKEKSRKKQKESQPRRSQQTEKSRSQKEKEKSRKDTQKSLKEQTESQSEDGDLNVMGYRRRVK